LWAECGRERHGNGVRSRSLAGSRTAGEILPRSPGTNDGLGSICGRPRKRASKTARNSVRCDKNWGRQGLGDVTKELHIDEVKRSAGARLRLRISDGQQMVRRGLGCVTQNLAACRLVATMTAGSSAQMGGASTSRRLNDQQGAGIGGTKVEEHFPQAPLDQNVGGESGRGARFGLSGPTKTPPADSCRLGPERQRCKFLFVLLWPTAAKEERK